jgi:recombination protein RecT
MKTNGSDYTGESKNSTARSLKEYLNSDYVKSRFMEVMGEKAPSFLASILNATQKNPDLAKCENQSLLSAAMVAATLDLPIDSNLGFAAIVPYNTKIRTKENGREVERWVTLAQFQIMYKGFIQLALRSGQYKTINVSPIYEDEFDGYDIITGDIKIHEVPGGFRDQENMDKIIGYVAFFRLINGFERLEYWPLSKLIAHGKKYSKSYDRKNSLWQKDPHVMYIKTPLKSLISRWGILSVTMQNAIAADQGTLKDWRKPIDSENINYIDSVTVTEEGEGETESAEDRQETQQQEESDGAENTETPVAETKAENGEVGGSTQETVTPTETTQIKGRVQGSPSKPNGDLFPKDEADALEEQYQRDHAVSEDNYPNFG